MLYRRVLADYPDDLEAWFQLGETLFHYNPLRGRPVAEARDAFDAVLRLDPDHGEALWHRAQIAAIERDRTGLERLLGRLAEADPESDRMLEVRALRTFGGDDAAAKARVLETLRREGLLTLSSIIWRTAVYLDDLADAGRVARLLLALRGVVAGWDGALPGANGAAKRRNVRAYLLALLDVALGDTATALERAGGIERRPGDDPRARPFAASIRAQVALRGGRHAEALAILERSPIEAWFDWAVTSPLHSRALDRFLRAELLRIEGREEEALRWYATFDEHAPHDLIFLAPSLLRRAEIREAGGDRRAALAHYRRFIELWRNADAELQPSVRRAAERARHRRARPRSADAMAALRQE